MGQALDPPRTAGQAWAESIGFEDPITFAPTDECKADDPRPLLAFSVPQDKDRITSQPAGYLRAGRCHRMVRLV